MKTLRIVLFVGILVGVLTSCKSLSKINTSDNDDVYLDPKRDRKEFFKAEASKVVEPVAASPIKQDSVDNNPYYKSKDFSYDDYYDNQYASRLKRFHEPMYGVGYYDSYYTNSYFYNNNPYQYGVSIYNGYSFWGPSYNNYMYVPNYSWGNNYGFGSPYGYNAYCANNWAWGGNSFGYNNFNNNYWNSPYYGNNFGGWGNPYYGNNFGGWGNTYNNNFGNNNFFGYNNPYDYNSNTYNGPRVSHSGGNSKQVINPGMNSNGKLMSQPVVDNSNPKTAIAPTDIKRFNVVEAPKQNITKGNSVDNESVPHILHNNNSNGNTNNPKTTQGSGVGTPIKGNSNSTPIVTEPKPKKGNIFNNETVPVIPRTNTNTNSNNDNPPPKKNYNYENSGGGKTNTFPSNNNSGGTTRPSSGGGGTIKPRR